MNCIQPERICNANCTLDYLVDESHYLKNEVEYDNKILFCIHSASMAPKEMLDSTSSK